MFRILLFIGFVGLFNACQNNYKNPNEDQNLFGEEFRVENKGTLELENVGDKTAAQFQAKVVSVCQKKGCWMKVVPFDAPADTLHVTFKDYDFFVPKDLSGNTVAINGVAFKKITHIKELKHYAEDANASAAEIAKIIAPKEEVRIEATGVRLLEN